MDDFADGTSLATGKRFAMKDRARQRIALSVLGSVEAVRDTVRRLVSIGIDAAALTVIAGGAALDGGLARLDAEIEAKEKHIAVVAREVAGKIAADGMPPGAALARFETWAPTELSRSLDYQLDAGNFVLVVPIVANEVEAPVSEVLLETATDRVQFHDVRIPPTT